MAQQRQAQRTRQVIGRECGAEPEGCPWKAFADPVVRDVIDLYQSARVGDGAHVASLLAANPPHHLWEGLRFYDMALTHALAEKRVRMRKRAEERARAEAARRGR